MTDTVLCVDIGTTSLKAGLISAAGEVVFLSVQTFNNPDSGYVALEWYAALKSAAAEILKSGKLKDCRILGIAVSGNGPTVVTENGATVKWNEILPENLKMPESCTTSLFIPRILTLREKFSEEFNKSKYIFSGPEFLIWQLTGRACTILPEKRYVAAYWNEVMLKDCGISAGKMPENVGIGTEAGKTGNSRYGMELGLGNLPVFTGGPDFIVAMIGTNTLDTGKICDRAGSSEGINYCSRTPVSADGIRLLPSVMSDCWNLAALQTESGRLLSDYKTKYEALYIEEKLNYTEFFNRLLAQKEGEGFEIVEKICRQMKASFEKLKKAVIENKLPFPEIINTTGGQTKNDRWMQKKADTLGVKMAVCNCSDCELIGDACAAFTGLGLYSDLRTAAKEIVKVTKIFTPGKELKE